MKHKKLVLLFLGIFLITILNTGCTASNSDTMYNRINDAGYKGSVSGLKDILEDENYRESNTWQGRKSAYDIAVEKGYKGTKEEWLETLIGNSSLVNEYTNGKTVYELACEAGFKGTLQEWLDSLTISQSTIVTLTETISESATEQNELFSVSFKNYDGELLKIDKVEKGGTATPPPTPQRTGYTFVGWDRTFDEIEFDVVINAQFAKITEPTILVERVDSFAGVKRVPVNIYIKNSPGITSLGLNVSYSQQLALQEIQYNTKVKGEVMQPGSLVSTTKLIWVSSFDEVKGDWLVATMYFDVLENSVGDLPISVTYQKDNIYNLSEENVTFDVVNGAVAIID